MVISCVKLNSFSLFFIDSQNEKVYFQDEQPSLTSTEKVPQHDFINKEMVNSEPLSTINEKGKRKIFKRKNLMLVSFKNGSN